MLPASERAQALVTRATPPRFAPSRMVASRPRSAPPVLSPDFHAPPFSFSLVSRLFRFPSLLRYGEEGIWE